MKRIYSIIILVALIIGISSCTDFLDTQPADKYDDGAVWNDPNLVESFVFNIYLGIPYPYQWYMNASFVDEAIPVQWDGIVSRILTSTMSPDDKGVFASNWGMAMHNWWWNSLYENIRACNLFFSKINDAQVQSDEYREQLKGEVYFLRGYFYYLAFVQYGGVPLVDYIFDIGDNYDVPRNTLAQTVDFIVKDLDEAIRLLKAAGQTDKTRGTEGAALALKSRVLLYAASDLFNSKCSWVSGYSNPELVSYMDDNRQKRWQDAKDAAEEVMKLGRYSLYEVDSDPSKNFADLFLQQNSNEQIFITYFDKIAWPPWSTDWIATICSPARAGGYGLNQVTANLANAFENRDGTYFNFEAQKTEPYKDRDPRFYATLLYDGADWVRLHMRNLPAYTVRPGRWIDANGVTTAVGTDNHPDINTGYYIRKFIDPNFVHIYFGDSRQPLPFIQFRYAEILLNYAEACIALGEEAEARTAINTLRKRAGMTEINDTGEELVKRYRNERRVELAWEQHRFFDVRRWMIASQAYGPAKGVEVIYPVAASHDNPLYREIDINEGEPRAWRDSHYLIPIGRSEMQRNLALIQNPGY